MTCGPGAQFGDVDHFRKVHLEDRPLAIAERNRILRVFGCLVAGTPRQLVDGRGRLPHRGLISLTSAGGFQFRRNVVSVLRGESLPDLDATTMPMHVTE